MSIDVRSSTKSLPKVAKQEIDVDFRPYKVKEEEIIENLLALGLLFLNNFNETICMQATSALSIVYQHIALINLDQQNEPKIIVGQ